MTLNITSVKKNWKIISLAKDIEVVHDSGNSEKRKENSSTEEKLTESEGQSKDGDDNPWLKQTYRFKKSKRKVNELQDKEFNCYDCDFQGNTKMQLIY